MFVSRQGEGPRIFVGIHGWAGSHRTFRRLLPYLPSDASFVAMDLPGYGASPPPREWSVDAIVSPLEELLAGIACEELTIIGNCGGSQFALEVARRGRSRVDRLVLVDPFAYPPLYFRIFTWGAFGRYAYLSAFANPAGRWLTNSALRRNRHRDTDLTKGFSRVDHSAVLAHLRVLQDLVEARAHVGLTTPTDIAYGERTFGGVRRSLPIWRADLPNVRLVELKGAGHEPLREAAEQLARLLFRPEREYFRDPVEAG